MPSPLDSLPQDVVAAWRAGNKIEAIKRLRESSPMGLAEAKAVIDALDGHGASGTGARPALPNVMLALQAKGSLPQAVAEAWRRGDKLGALMQLGEAMKAARVQTRAAHDEPKAMHGGHTHKVPAPPVLPADMLGPGEVPRSKSGPGLILALAVAVAAMVWLYETFA